MKKSAIILDIEGTTTSIRFVYDTLFPYIRSHVGLFLEAKWDDDAVQADVTELSAQARQDLDDGVKDAPQIPDEASSSERLKATLDNIHWQMDSDRKTTGLKSLQGKIWRDGYLTGELKGHIYPDVEPALQRWSAAGIPVYIYSSGSVAAQRLLFGHSERGDLTHLLSGYFDTTTGPKKVEASYTQIAKDIGAEPSSLLFVTDHIDEARAARAAGLEALLSIRPGNAELPEHDFAEVRSFDGI